MAGSHFFFFLLLLCECSFFSGLVEVGVGKRARGGVLFYMSAFRGAGRHEILPSAAVSAGLLPGPLCWSLPPWIGHASQTLGLHRWQQPPLGPEAGCSTLFSANGSPPDRPERVGGRRETNRRLSCCVILPCGPQTRRGGSLTLLLIHLPFTAPSHIQYKEVRAAARRVIGYLPTAKTMDDCSLRSRMFCGRLLAKKVKEEGGEEGGGVPRG